MWELDYEESWAPKNWCFWTVVLEKTPESPLDCKEIQPVHPKGDQSWVFIGGTDAEAETLILWPPDAESWFIWKDPNAGKDWGQEEKGMTEDEMIGWHHWHSGHGFGCTQGVGDGQGGLAYCRSWSCKKLDMTEQLNWTLSTCTILIRVYNYFIAQIFSFVPCVSSPSSYEYRSGLPTIDISENNMGEFAWEYWRKMVRMLGNANIKEEWCRAARWKSPLGWWQRWWSRKTLSWHPPMGTQKWQVFTEQFPMRTTWKQQKSVSTAKHIKKEPQWDR